MWIYDKKTQMPIHIRNKNPKLASYILSQYGGPDGELSASVRYLSHALVCPTKWPKPC